MYLSRRNWAKSDSDATNLTYTWNISNNKHCTRSALEEPMKYKTKKYLGISQKGLSFFAVFFFLVTTVLLSREVSNLQKRFGTPLKASFTGDPMIPARNVVVYEPPVFGTTGAAMTLSYLDCCL